MYVVGSKSNVGYNTFCLLILRKIQEWFLKFIVHVVDVDFFIIPIYKRNKLIFLYQKPGTANVMP